MKYLKIIAIIFPIIMGCNHETANQEEVDNSYKASSFSLRLYKTESPLSLKGIAQSAFNDSLVNKSHLQAIGNLFWSYYNENNIDASRNDIYLGTVAISFNDIYVYQNIYKHHFGSLNSNYCIIKKDKQVGEAFSFNIHAMYKLGLSKILTTNLYDLFYANTPEIDLSDEGNAIRLRAIRLSHNGTFNQIQIQDHFIYPDTLITLKDSINLTIPGRSTIPNTAKCISEISIKKFNLKDTTYLPSGNYDNIEGSEYLLAYITLRDTLHNTTIFLIHNEDVLRLQRWANKYVESLVIESTSDDIEPMKLQNKSFVSGVMYACNVGDLNNDFSDEIALVFHQPDLSNVNTMYLFSYTNRKWGLLAEWPIRENNLVGIDHVHSHSKDSLMIRTMDQEAIMTDSIIPINSPYYSNWAFDVVQN